MPWPIFGPAVAAPSTTSAPMTTAAAGPAAAPAPAPAPAPALVPAAVPLGVAPADAVALGAVRAGGVVLGPPPDPPSRTFLTPSPCGFDGTGTGRLIAFFASCSLPIAW